MAEVLEDKEMVDVHPLDKHNRELVDNVHPASWNNPEPSGRYNIVVIGAGTAGLVTAAGAAGLGARVALIERHLLGGDCLNYGCVPSKALIRAGRAYADVRDAARYGVSVPLGTRVDFEAVMERMRRLRSSISRHDSAGRFRDLGVDVFLGSGRFTGPRTVQVAGIAGDRTLEFSKACIATGARAAAPPIPGLKEAGFLTNETVFSLTRLPSRLAVIGAGPIGCEMAQAFTRFGSKVCLLQSAPQVLHREEPEAALRVQKSLLADGVQLFVDAKVNGASAGPEGKKVRYSVGGKDREVEVDEILVGVGRSPNVEGLALEAAGVEYDATAGVMVNDNLRTTNPSIYAAGDICFPYQFTHTADALARIVIQNALFNVPLKGRARTSALTIPWCTYTDPELAHVGLSPEEARKRGIEVETFTQEFREVDRAVLDGDDDGLARIHVKKGTGRIVGATVVARHAGEMIGEIALAMTGGLGMKTLSATIHPYPTQAEALKRLGDAYLRTQLKPWVKSVLRRWFAWTR